MSAIIHDAPFPSGFLLKGGTDCGFNVNAFSMATFGSFWNAQELWSQKTPLTSKSRLTNMYRVVEFKKNLST